MLAPFPQADISSRGWGQQRLADSAELYCNVSLVPSLQSSQQYTCCKGPRNMQAGCAHHLVSGRACLEAVQSCLALRVIHACEYLGPTALDHAGNGQWP